MNYIESKNEKKEQKNIEGLCISKIKTKQVFDLNIFLN